VIDDLPLPGESYAPAITSTNGNYVLGSKLFEEEIAITLGQRVSRGKSGRPSGQSTARDWITPPLC